MRGDVFRPLSSVGDGGPETEDEGRSSGRRGNPAVAGVSVPTKDQGPRTKDEGRSSSADKGRKTEN